MRLALKTVYTIWLREAKTFVREKFRVVAIWRCSATASARA